MAGTEREKHREKQPEKRPEKKPEKHRKKQPEKQQQNSKGGVGAGAIVGTCIVLLLIIAMAAWCVYAYRNPTTKSGLFLIDVSGTRLFGTWYRSSGLSQFCLFSYCVEGDPVQFIREVFSRLHVPRRRHTLRRSEHS